MSEEVILSEGTTLLRQNGAVLPASAIGAAGLPTSPVTITQTFPTTAATVPAATAVVVATTAASLASFGYAQAQADALVTAVNALVADTLALRKTQNQIIDILQAAGLAL